MSTDGEGGELVVRRAQPGDVEAIAEVQHRAWLHAYDFLGPRLGEYEPRARAQRIAVRLDEPGGETWVAELAATIVGFVATGPADDPDADQRCGRLASLYVDPIAQGAGVGGRLHGLAVERLRTQGFAHATLWTFAQNEAAQHFYEHRGWAYDPSGVGLERPQWLGPTRRMRIELHG